MFGKKKQKMTESELRNALVELLFPQFDIVEGDKGKYVIDYSIDNNIESVIQDIQDNEVDQITTDTLRRLSERLQKARELLEVEQYAPPHDVKYFTVLPDKIKD